MPNEMTAGSDAMKAFKAWWRERGSQITDEVQWAHSLAFDAFNAGRVYAEGRVMNGDTQFGKMLRTTWHAEVARLCGLDVV